MIKYTTYQAKTYLSKLLQQVARGEEIIILSGDKPVARLIPYESRKRGNLIGALEGKLEVGPDFNKIATGFEKYT